MAKIFWIFAENSKKYLEILAKNSQKFRYFGQNFSEIWREIAKNQKNLNNRLTKPKPNNRAGYNQTGGYLATLVAVSPLFSSSLQ